MILSLITKDSNHTSMYQLQNLDYDLCLEAVMLKKSISSLYSFIFILVIPNLIFSQEEFSIDTTSNCGEFNGTFISDYTYETYNKELRFILNRPSFQGSQVSSEINLDLNTFDLSSLLSTPTQNRPLLNNLKTIFICLSELRETRSPDHQWPVPMIFLEENKCEARIKKNQLLSTNDNSSIRISFEQNQDESLHDFQDRFKSEICLK